MRNQDWLTPESSKSVSRLLRHAYLFGAMALCLLFLWPFVPALTGTLSLAIITNKPYAFLKQKIANRTAAAVTGIICVTLCIVVPLLFALRFVLQKAALALALLQDPHFEATLLRVSSAVQSLEHIYHLPATQLGLAQTFQRVLSFLTGLLVSAFSGSISAFTQIVVMLFLLFFWYRDDERMRGQVIRLLPFTQAERRLLRVRLMHTFTGTVIGRLIVAVLQGALAWCAFWMLRVPGAPLLGALTSVCAIFPAIGAYFVWVPVVAYLLVIHAWARALILVILGVMVLSTADNIIFPMIAGARTRIDTVQMFLCIFGGVWLFGISGLVLGPLCWSLAESLLFVLQRERKVRSPNQEPEPDALSS